MVYRKSQICFCLTKYFTHKLTQILNLWRSQKLLVHIYNTFNGFWCWVSPKSHMVLCYQSVYNSYVCWVILILCSWVLFKFLCQYLYTTDGNLSFMEYWDDSTDYKVRVDPYWTYFLNTTNNKINSIWPINILYLINNCF